ncbi:hypothetical protein SLEP1_g50000 [Rubroshorea leprosula]|uniref:NB-ARC domain-containing protein n=1 Tax=Rubroshorea leprosula TaxID=152421 RepID=A0AAV5LZI8_9ROSI|nr:hypothetical protein SLEP1_g50000 [Rubroshorea leprosula]
MADIALTFVTPLIELALSKAASFAAEQITLAWGLEKELEELADSLTLIQGGARRRGEETRKQSGHRPLFTKYRSRTDRFLPVNLKVFGRKHGVLDIVRLLQDLRDKHPLSGISVVGMPGVGKTTLAKSIYKTVYEAKLYDLASWVCVSEDFNVQKLLVEILEHFNYPNAGAINNMNILLQYLVKEIENKTFLLILDDVWNEDQHKWEDFIDCLLKIPGLESDKKGEKESEDVQGKGLKSESDDEGKVIKGTTSITKISIVITTRVQNAASMIEGTLQGDMHRHFVEELSTDVCWCIIKEKVLRSSGQKSLPPKLEYIAQDIAKKCGGLPLVETVIGVTLGRHIEEDKWLAIRNSNAWDIEDASQILSVLKISYDHLGVALKKCFSYCSIFPKDFAMEKDDLVQLWMAQGFLYQSNESNKTMEEIGNQHFDELLSNSLFQDVERDHFGNILSCKMHDIVHDLGLFVSKDETLIWENGSSVDENSKIRHLRVKYDRNVLPTIPRGVAQRLHSLFLDVDDVDVFNDMALKFKRLRCLKLVGANTKELPASLGKLKHLKYLSISKNGIRVLPKSFSKLYNLQTLRLQSCHYVEKLLMALETCRKGSNCNDEEVLDGLQPDSNLKYLSIFGYLGEKFPLWMTGGVKGGASFQLENLVELTLFNCNGCTCFPSVGLLPSLEVLCIKGMAKVKSMGHSLMYDLEEWVEVIEGEEAATGGESIRVFPCLEELLIEDCPELKTCVMGGFSSHHKLCSLTIHNCPNLIAIPNMDGLTSLKISLGGCDGPRSSPPTPPSPSPPLPNFRLSPTSTLQGNSKASRN